MPLITMKISHLPKEKKAELTKKDIKFLREQGFEIDWDPEK